MTWLVRGLGWLDAQVNTGTRKLARRSSRRGFLGQVSTLVLGAGLLPLLPVSRSFGAEGLEEIGDPQSCDYWRYCALGGTLCSCCGGSVNTCPPGS